MVLSDIWVMDVCWVHGLFHDLTLVSWALVLVMVATSFCLRPSLHFKHITHLLFDAKYCIYWISESLSFGSHVKHHELTFLITAINLNAHGLCYSLTFAAWIITSCMYFLTFVIRCCLWSRPNAHITSLLLLVLDEVLTYNIHGLTGNLHGLYLYGAHVFVFG